MGALIDACGRKIDYLRLSVTDRCDLRCAYCMPEDYADYEAPGHWLSFDEIERLTGIFVSLGVTRIRLTGGEPLLRGRIVELVAKLRRHSGLSDLSLSTNGTRLARMAARLKSAGVDRINVSLDTLSRSRFLALTRRDALGDVLAGLEEARNCGFTPIKINMVWLPDFNGDEIGAMIEYCMDKGFVLRLIENMPMSDSARALGTGSLQALIESLRKRYDLVDHVLPGGGPARYLTTPDNIFSIGFITPVSQHFCATCNRIRLTVDGALHLCLGQEDRLELRHLLRTGASDSDLIDAIQSAMQRKPDRHEFSNSSHKLVRVMASTGG
ncbi:GTP 3',8-cyclase MoaA [Denitratisoma oestradiolicum]|nr:GTP 3',8-cyclase MoaA [Denitratisoma oestradiolicum]